jgi:BatD DUF11 like domain
MKQLVFNIIIFLFFSTSILAQVTFEATTDAKQVPLGEIFEVKFTLKNAKGERFRPPVFSDFTVVGGPNQMNSMTVVNGSATSSETYSYVLQAKREGKLTLGSAEILAKGQSYSTPPLSIEVTKGKKQTINEAKSSKDAVFIRAEVSSHEAYIGQQIVLDYKLYTRVDLNGMSLLSEPSYNGFFHLEINDYPHGENRVTIGGKSYLSRTLRRVALFVQKEGEAVIQPMTVQVGVVKGKNDDPFFDPFFSSVRSENQTIQSNSVNIYVKPLPTNAPASFTGGVGDFMIETNISKTEATTDDAISLKMRIMGNGDTKRWQAPKMSAIEGLEIYEPKVLREENTESQGEWQAIKEIEYLILPKKAGNYTLKPEFSYFSPESNSFKILTPNTFVLNITQGKNALATIQTDKPTDIRGIKTATVFTNQTTSFHNTGFFWALFILPFLFLLGVLGYKQYLIQRGKVDVNILKSQNAQKVSERRLAIAQEFLRKGNHRLFYDEVSKALFTYVSDKVGIPMSEFSKSSTSEKLHSLNVKEVNIEKLLQILQKCEIALFAGQNTEGAMNDVFQDALNVITDIEDDLKN